MPMASGSNGSMSGVPALPSSVQDALLREVLEAVREERRREIARLEADEERRSQVITGVVFRVLGQVADALQVKQYYEAKKQALQEYAGVNSLCELPEKVIALPEVQRKVLSLLWEKHQVWEKSNQELAAIFRTLRFRSLRWVMRKLGIASFLRLPADRVQLAKRLIESRQ